MKIVLSLTFQTIDLLEKKNTTTIDPGPLVVKLDIKNDAFKNINKMNIIFDRSKDFEGYEILYQNKDCYFVKKR